MKSIVTIGKPIGRAKFCIFYLFTMFLYGGALYFIQGNHIIYSLIQFVLVVVSLLILIYIIEGRLVDIGRKKSQLYLLLIPIYNIYLLFLLFIKKGTK